MAEAQSDDKLKALTTNNIIRLLQHNNFRFSKYWRGVARELNVSLEERAEHQLSALHLDADFSYYLEEIIDHWLRNSDEPSWEKIIEVIAKFEKNTAKNMKSYLGIADIFKGIYHSMSVDSDPRCEHVSSSTLSSTTPASKLISDETIPISTTGISMRTTTSTTAVSTTMMPTITGTSTCTSTETIPATKQSCDDNPKLIDLLKSMTIEDDQQIEINCKVYNADTNELIQSTRDPLTRDIKIARRRPPRVQEFSSDSVKIGTSIRLEISSDSDCYLYVLNVGTSGKTSLLLPNEFERDHYFHANQTYYLPAEDFGFEIEGPSGKETIQVLAFSQKQSDLDKLYGEIIHEKELYRDIKVRRKTKVPVDKKGYAQVQFNVIV